MIATAEHLEDGGTRLMVAGARYASLTGTSFTYGGVESRGWDLSIHLTPEHASALCAALRDLRDADHEEALRDHADRTQEAAMSKVAVPAIPELAEVRG